MNNDNKAKSVVTEVTIVLDKVSLIDKFNKSVISFERYLRKFSLTLSYTTTVSFIEYPTIVSIAAMMGKLNSN